MTAREARLEAALRAITGVYDALGFRVTAREGARALDTVQTIALDALKVDEREQARLAHEAEYGIK